MKKPVELHLSKLAEIKLFSLPERTLKQFEHYSTIIKNDFNSSDLHGKLFKFRTPVASNIYTLKFGVKYRAIIKLEENQITIIDIVNHSELRKIFGKGGQNA